MALKLAGEECSVVQGLDSEGYVETVRTLLPDNDDSRYLGSATLGWKGVHFPNFLLAEVGSYLAARDNANTVYKDFRANRFYGANIEATSRFKASSVSGCDFVTDASVTAYLPFKGYGTGAYVEHARLAPNNFELKNGKLTGNLDCNGQQALNHILETFTEATKPAATGNAGRVIYVSDAVAGSKFQGSDGASWLGLG